MNNKQIMKWLGEYEQMLRLAKKRGKSWARKHRTRFLWLKKRVQAIAIQFDEPLTGNIA